ncbi:REX2 (YLR059C) [Zygosaccharomyces parabailii]|uniref:ZYBA0S15-00562g1_1 n=1 Tax=Zygosaccharomyces bailii (strain CLIB 213 / ATCC 58445 / CBS 680 / BCRC 21525 / NBRC 1098 / NCYC 1416 / NRRL Y-2227) TaxID=1333698 RepID=A0A8J2TBL1_ZYGB2|nr:REX2 (YLR059C) [Zygosaccharomyces parabailii]CDF91875.1 ZYBA0S15-00562g1_1 [Zygosaccharomyces bailii CLIB 213]CDH13900.1 related to Oligoribonuclease, mitochondrial [Zygosaccharomyces bailii ISA1307]
MADMLTRRLVRLCTRPLYRASNPYLTRMSQPGVWKPLVWIDCEMTGLDHTHDRIIEICCIITDGHLKVIDNNCFESVVHCDKEVMDKMNPWCLEHHGASGLIEKVLASSKTKEEVEDELLHFIKRYVPEQRTGLLAGNSVHMDRLFMLKDFPKVLQHLHYRIVDVSTIMEVSFRHNPALASQQPKKVQAHTARQDILESIQQLQWYVDNYFKPPEEAGSQDKRTTSDVETQGADKAPVIEEPVPKRSRHDQ